MDKPKSIEYICIPCNEIFVNLQDLNHHYMKEHIRINFVYEEKKKRGKPDETNCLICGKKITQIWNRVVLYCSKRCRAKAYRNRLTLLKERNNPL